MTGSLPVSLVLFAVAAIVIAIAGVQLTKRAEQIAEMTGLGQLLTGAVLIGAVTSLSGSITSVTAAWEGHGSLAVSNALGGIAAQTTFLALADMVYRRSNLEHAAASEANLIQGTALIALLTLPITGMVLPGLAVFGVHPVSVLIIAGYVLSLRLTRGAQNVPMWQPRITDETRQDQEASGDSGGIRPMSTWISFAVLAVLVGSSGWVLAQTAVPISSALGVRESVMGGLFTAVTTSMPELVVAVTAVRRGALSLAVGDILGGNTYDVLILTASDVAFRQGSIYSALTQQDVAWVALAILLAAVMLLGLLRREKHGIGNIGFESVLILALYVGGVTALATN